MAVTQTVKTLNKKLEYKISIRPSQEKKLEQTPKEYIVTNKLCLYQDLLLR